MNPSENSARIRNVILLFLRALIILVALITLYLESQSQRQIALNHTLETPSSPKTQPSIAKAIPPEFILPFRPDRPIDRPDRLSSPR